MKDCVSPAGASAGALDGKMVWNKLFDWKKKKERRALFFMAVLGRGKCRVVEFFLIGKMRGAKTLPEC